MLSASAVSIAALVVVGAWLAVGPQGGTQVVAGENGTQGSSESTTTSLVADSEETLEDERDQVQTPDDVEAGSALTDDFDAGLFEQGLFEWIVANDHESLDYGSFVDPVLFPPFNDLAEFSIAAADYESGFGISLVGLPVGDGFELALALSLIHI